MHKTHKLCINTCPGAFQFQFCSILYYKLIYVNHMSLTLHYSLTSKKTVHK